jgi:hypothetical protein
MLIINSNKKDHFAGYVIVHSEQVFVDTLNGTGFTRIFELMEGTINKITNHYSQFTPEHIDDIRQDICVKILEGILRYDKTKGTSLSTFLFSFVHKKMIDEVRKTKTRYKYKKNQWVTSPSYKDPSDKIELMNRIKGWDDRWKEIMIKLFVNGEKIFTVASSEDMTPWGLTRAVRRKLKEARRI